MLREACGEFSNVDVALVPGLVVEFARKVGATVIVRGLRAVSDFEFELQMASTNRELAPEVETIFFTPAPRYHYVSASIVAEIASFGGDVDQFVPANVARRLRERFAPSEGSSGKEACFCTARGDLISIGSSPTSIAFARLCRRR
jgi:pantetheine-phosphate adenylyltransferase